MRRPLFLRWLCWHLASTGALVAGAIAFSGRAHGEPLYVAGATLALALAASLYAGRIFWELDRPPVRVIADDPDAALARYRDGLRRRAQHVFFAAEICQLLGLVGAAVGFGLIATAKSHGSANVAAHHIVDSLGAGIVATVCGVLCSIVLLVEHHGLRQTIR